MDGSLFRLEALPIPIPVRNEGEKLINNGIDINPGLGDMPISSPPMDLIPSSVDSGIWFAMNTSEVNKADRVPDLSEGDENCPIKDLANHSDLNLKISIQPFRKILGMTYDTYSLSDCDAIIRKFQKCPPDRVYVLHDIQDRWKPDHQKIGIRFCDYEAEMILFIDYCRYDDLEDFVIRKAKNVRHIAF